MKKIFYILASAIVALGAVACENDGLDNIGLEVNGDTVSFIASIDNTKTDLQQDGNVWKTIWKAGDVITVVWEGEKYLFTNSDKNVDVFSCTADGLSAIVNAKMITATYAKNYDDEGNGYIDSQEGTAGALLTYTGSFTELANGDEGFKVQNAFLKFTTTEKVTLKGAGLFVENGVAKDEITITGTGKEQYVAVNPTTDEIAFSYSVGGVQCKSLVKNFEVRKIYNLGYLGGKVSLSPGVWDVDGAWFAARFYNGAAAASVNALTRAGEVDEAWVKMTDDNYDGVYECLVPGAYNSVIFCRMDPSKTELSWSSKWNQSADLTIDNKCFVISGDKDNYDNYIGTWGVVPTAPTYGVVGSFQSPTTWDVAKPVVFVFEKDYWYVAKDIELYKNDEFKVVTGNSWDNPSYGLASVGVLAVDEEVELQTSNSQNMKAAKNGKFDIYFNVKTHQIKYTCVKEYTDLKVTITINNEANWSPLKITLKDGSETVVDNATVTDNKYAVSGDYIGKTLSYTLSSGSKTSTGSVTIANKNGATINLVEEVIKFVFKLTKQNSKSYWGNTAKIHIWNADKSIATSWPGVTMTYDGNYTWHYDIPASLAGTKMTFLIHNGNGWQSKNEPTVTLSVNGHTYTDADDSMKIQ